VIIVPDDDFLPAAQHECKEDGVEVPLDRINPDTLQNLISEFVSREWGEMGDSGHTLADKISQVQRQLQAKKVKVVFDLTTESCNIVPCER